MTSERLRFIRIFLGHLPLNIGILIALQPGAFAASFEYVNVLDSTNSPGQIFGFPALNNNGEIAFSARHNGLWTLYYGNKEQLQTNPTFDQYANFDLGVYGFSDAGQMALKLGDDSNGIARIMLVDGTSTVTIQEGTSAWNRWGGLSLNQSGEVAYAAGVAYVGGEKVYCYTEGFLTTAVDYSGPISGMSYAQDVSLNNHGQIVFSGYGRSSPTEPSTPGGFICDHKTGKITRFANGSTVSGRETALAPTINDSGDIAYIDWYTSKKARLLKKVGTNVTLIAQAEGGYSFVTRPLINNNGDVLFEGKLVDGSAGLFVGPDPTKDCVIAKGDGLFNSTVVSTAFYRGFNDLGQVAFAYRLANGVSGVAIAVPVPEPSVPVHLIIPAMIAFYGIMGHKKR